MKKKRESLQQQNKTKTPKRDKNKAKKLIKEIKKTLNIHILLTDFSYYAFLPSLETCSYSDLFANVFVLFLECNL